MSDDWSLPAQTSEGPGDLWPEVLHYSLCVACRSQLPMEPIVFCEEVAFPPDAAEYRRHLCEANV